MARAIWEGVVIAESDQCVVVEGNQYFPPTAVRREYFHVAAADRSWAAHFFQ
jgi:uncharacterized protein (DUF427 family)